MVWRLSHLQRRVYLGQRLVAEPSPEPRPAIEAAREWREPGVPWEEGGRQREQVACAAFLAGLVFAWVSLGRSMTRSTSGHP